MNRKSLLHMVYEQRAADESARDIETMIPAVFAATMSGITALFGQGAVPDDTSVYHDYPSIHR